MAIALVYGARQVSTHQMTEGSFFSSMAGAAADDGPAKKLSRVNANLQQTMAASERIFDMLDTHTEVKGTRRRPGHGAV
jgi:subfamily B ATP-binding cassette protein MsbA